MRAWLFALIVHHNTMSVLATDALTRERTGDEISGERFCLIADKIEADPVLLQIGLNNIARWLGRGHSATKRLESWRSMILAAQTSSEGMSKLLGLLRDPSPDAIMWKEYSPFPGVLNKEELDRLSWTTSH